MRSDGRTGTRGEVTARLGDIKLASNPFWSDCTDAIARTEQARSQPDTQGAGLVRCLCEAASLQNSAGNPPAIERLSAA